jgi:hypothetical protein
MSRRTWFVPALGAITALGLVLVPGGIASGSKAPAVTIDYKASACMQLPSKGTGTVRFFVREVNHTNRVATFGKQISMIWLRPDGWKDSWMNTIDGTDKVPANRAKTFWTEFGADPTKLILRCAIKIQDDDRVHNVKVLR